MMREPKERVRKTRRNTEKALPAEQRAPTSDYCWGRNPVVALLQDAPARCLKVQIAKTAQRATVDRLVGLCRSAQVPYAFVETRALDAILVNENHQGVVATIAPVELMRLSECANRMPPPPGPALAVLLDHVQDPHNVGAMIRSAEAASASFLALPVRRSSLPTGTVAKTSAGASLRLPIAAVGNTANAVRDLQEAGLWTVGLDGNAERTIYDSPLPARCLFVVGGEGKGLTVTTRAACDEALRIPIRGGAGSLNASIALAVAMFEWSRQHSTDWKRKE